MIRGNIQRHIDIPYLLLGCFIYSSVISVYSMRGERIFLAINENSTHLNFSLMAIKQGKRIY